MNKYGDMNKLPAFFFLPFDSGLGNQLFIAAAALAYGAHSNRSVVIVVDRADSQNRHGWFLDLVHFSDARVWRGPVATFFSRLVNLTLSKSGNNGLVFDWRSAGGFDEERRLMASSALIYRGYFQTSNLGIPFEYRPLITPYDRHYNPAKDIAIHVRRGDYLDARNRDRYGIVSIEDLLREGHSLARGTGGQLVIFSDSPDLVGSEIAKLSLDSQGCRVRILSSEDLSTSPLNEFVLMAEFRHLVISNSTFSLWAGRLGPQPKTVVAPWPWFKSGEQPMNLLPAHWQNLTYEARLDG